MPRFAAIVLGLMAVFYGVFYTPPGGGAGEAPVFRAYLSGYARVCGALLGLFDRRVAVTGQTISSPRFSMQVVRGCDAMEATALLAACVLAFPVSIRARVMGAVAGVLLLAVLNLARLVTLFYIGVLFPRQFEFIHIDVWQVVFFLAAIVIWVAWALWATRRIIQPLP